MNSDYNIIQINGKRIKLARHLMEEKIGRKLTFDEVVHHKNGKKKDDRMENLELMDNSKHLSFHGAGRRKNEKM